MRRSTRYFFLVALAAALPVAGYGVMHLLVYIFPMSGGSDAVYLLFTLILIALGLGIPYWMLKAGVSASALHRRGEHGFHLSDIPKDKDELNHKDPSPLAR